ncbi:MAG: PLDc N-terminal domain-containing protein, partial [Planctomycetota bacterium]
MTWFDWSLVFFIASWAISLVMIPVVVMRKEHPTTCLAWLMIVFFVPWLGLVLYLLLGEDRLVRKRLRWREQSEPNIDTMLSGLTCDVEDYDDASPANDDRKSLLARLGCTAGGLPLTEGNLLELITETSAVIDRLIEDIDAAEHHIHLLFYIYEVDTVGRRVSDALLRAKARGVECRVLADAVGSWGFFGPMAAELKTAGIDVAECLPVGLMRRRLARIDLRNHRKL